MPSDPAGGGDLSARLDALNSLDPQQLREEWRRLYRSQPPRLSRDLMIRGIAWRMQELAFGGLGKVVERRLAALSTSIAAGAPVSSEPISRIRAGARLVREWHGRSHAVVVTEDGFSYEGQTYRSLTRIARDITGARWSGPRFFGLQRKPARGGAAGGPADPAVADSGEEAADA